MRRLVLVLFLAACGDGDPADSPDAGPQPDAGPTLPSFGYIRLAEVDGTWGPSGTARAQMVLSGLPVWHLEEAAQGACRLLRFQPAYCDTWCDGVCVEPNVCQPWPTYANAGTLSFTGVKGAVSLSFDPGWGYATAAVPPDDLFDPGDEVTVNAAGAEIPAFSLTARGTAALQSPTIVDDEVTLANGADFTFSWTPAGGDARVRLTINANNMGHGAPYAAIIVCDVADAAGAVTVPRSMIDVFPATMAWEACAGSDCPPSSLFRYTRAALPQGDGELEFLVGSERLFGVNHAAN